MNFDSFIPAIQAGRIDTCQPIFVKPERCQVLTFATPHLKEGQSCIVPSGNPKGIQGWDDLLAKDVQVGLIAGTTPNEIAKNIKLPDNRITRFPDTTALTAGMKSGRVDAIVEASSTLRLIAEDLPQSEFERVQAWGAPSAGDVQIDYYASFPFHAQAKALRDAFDEELQKLVAGGTILDITGEYGFTEDDLPGDSAPSLDELCSA
jgi:polar amino acid transport system substrate-binding protein